MMMMVAKAVALISVGVILLMHNINCQDDSTTTVSKEDVTVPPAEGGVTVSENDTIIADCKSIHEQCISGMNETVNRLDETNRTFPINYKSILDICRAIKQKVEDCNKTKMSCPPSADWSHTIKAMVFQRDTRCSEDIICHATAVNCRHPLLTQLNESASLKPSQEVLCRAYNTAVTCYYEFLELVCFLQNFIMDFIKKGMQDLNPTTCPRDAAGSACKLAAACRLSGSFTFPCDGIGNVMQCMSDLRGVPECNLMEDSAKFKDLAKAQIDSCSVSDNETNNDNYVSCFGANLHCLKDSELYQKNLQYESDTNKTKLISDFSAYLLNSAHWCSYMKTLDKCSSSLSKCGVTFREGLDTSKSVDSICVQSTDSAGSVSGNPMLLLLLLVTFLLICWKKIALY